MRTLDIGLDIDGVLYPYSTVFTRAVEKEKGLPPGTLRDEALSWRWYKEWGAHSVTDEEFLDLMAVAVKHHGLFLYGQPYPGALHAVRRLHEDGHRIHYISARSWPGEEEGEALNLTTAWLRMHGFPSNSITISTDKFIRPTDVFLDDAPQNISALSAAGHPNPMLWDRSHNRATTLPLRALRLYDWDQFGIRVRYLARGLAGAA